MPAAGSAEQHRFPDADLGAQWQVVDAFIAAAREGDFDALVAVLTRTSSSGPMPALTSLSSRQRCGDGRGSGAHGRVDLSLRRALISRAAGMVSLRGGRPFSVGSFIVKNGRIVEIDILADPERGNWILTILGE